MEVLEWINEHLTKKTSVKNLDKNLMEELKSYRPRSLHEQFPEEYKEEDDFTLFRGLAFKTREDFESFMINIKEGVLTENDITSWTWNYGIADNFMHGAGLIEKEKFYGGVMLSAEISVDSILFHAKEAIYELLEEGYNEAADFAEREDEFILMPGSYKVNVEKNYIS